MSVSLVCNYHDNGASNIAVVVSFFDPCCGPWCKKCGILNVAFYMMSVLALELISYKRNAMCMAALCCNGFGVPARHLSVLCWQSVSENFSSSSNVSVLLPFLHFSDYSQKRRLKARGATLSLSPGAFILPLHVFAAHEFRASPV